MLSAINELFLTLFGTVFPAWLNCPAIQYLVSLAIVAMIVSMLITLLRP